MKRPCFFGIALLLLFLSTCAEEDKKRSEGEPKAETKLASAQSVQSPAERTGSRPNLIIISIDTLRPDHLGLYGYWRDTSPHLDELGKEAVVFERCLSQASWTPPSVASLFTSLYPPQHGSLGRDQIPLSDQNLTLAEMLSAAGYSTAAFSASPFIHPDFGFGQGFAEFSFEPSEDAMNLNRLVLAWLTRPPSEPFFLYVMFFDPHFSYRPPPPFNRKFQNSPEGKPLWKEKNVTRINSLFDLKATVGRETLEFLKSQYDGEIAYTDQALGVLLAELKKQGLLDRSLLVLTSDHGEEFLEHADFGHGNTLYQEAIRVLLMLREPGPSRSGRRIQTLVRQIDILPTALELLGLPLPAKVEGQSLAPLLHQDGASEDRTAFASSRHLFHQGETMRALVKWPLKIILFENPSRAELYDLQQDPEEQNNLASQRPDLLRQMTAELINWERVMLPSPVGKTYNPPPEKTHELLKALGYLR